jgi:hypothetical protein
MMSRILCFLLISGCFSVSGQHFRFTGADFSNIKEGEKVDFKVLSTDSAAVRHFYIDGGEVEGMELDSAGRFTWTPGYNSVGRSDRPKDITVMLAALLAGDKSVRQTVTFTVHHVNREPVIEDLPVFYVRQGVKNSYQISSDYVYDPDGDPLQFKPVQNTMPEGMQISSNGLISWTPSRSQYAGMKTGMIIEFIVLDQPEKAERHGKIRIAHTQLDLPPELILVPGDSIYSIKEDEVVNFKVYISDPNGDENLSTGGFVASDTRVPATVYRENSNTQAEFSWSPGYKFVDEAEKFRQVDITFFALDKAANRIQRRIRVKVTDAENLDEKDKFIYQKYVNSLTSAKSLLDQLDLKYADLSKMYKQAKRGKKHRAIINASLGAATGLSPVVLPTETSKVVSGIGGTTVLTLGTLEATEVIGKSKSDIIEQMKICVEIRNQLQVEGENFARKYALKSERRKKEFDTDREKLLPILNNQKLILLELDASQRSNKIDSKDLKKTFTDFSEGLE